MVFTSGRAGGASHLTPAGVGVGTAQPRPRSQEGVMIDEPQRPEAHREELPLSKAAQYLLEECRMALPGIQAS